MIHKQAILEKIHLQSLVGSDLKKVAATAGGEYAGPCPFCGGDDRFRVQPNRKPWGWWMCRRCTDGRWRNAIDFVMERDNCDFITACKALAGDSLPTTDTRRPTQTPAKPAYRPPETIWQESAQKALEICQANLWGDPGKRALPWLREKRGFSDKTIKRFGLGLSEGGELAGLYVPRGLVIPCIVGGEVWYLKIRTSSNEKGKKYQGVKGNRTAAIYNADELTPAAPGLLCEGEFDCMLAWQELGDVVTPVTFGAAGNLPDLATWGAYILPVSRFLLAYDADPAGENGAAKVMDLVGQRAELALLPDGPWKDITDYYQAGGDLWEWIRAYLPTWEELAT